MGDVAGSSSSTSTEARIGLGGPGLDVPGLEGLGLEGLELKGLGLDGLGLSTRLGLGT
jgi:hypothetical protein